MTARRSAAALPPESRSTYREFAPSPALSPFIECFWTRDVIRRSTSTVLPDGCVDAIFFLHQSEQIKATVVGAMTAPQRVTLKGTQSILGIRFHPGMAGLCLPVDLPRLTDQTVPLRQLLGTDVNDFFGDLVTDNCIERRISLIERRVSRLPHVTAVHAAISELVGRSGQISVEEMAAVAGVSPRQLQRTCLRNSGLAPKRLSRILRFRQAVGLIQKTQTSCSAIAAKCGYFDQSHMIRDFHELAGASPEGFVRCRA